MLTRKFSNVYTAWRGLTEELAYRGDKIGALRWGASVAYPGLIEVEITNVADDGGLHLGMASFTKSRWTRFMRRYFRPDLQAWVAESMSKIKTYPHRPFVAGYSMNLNLKAKKLGAGVQGGHNYGSCLGSLQIRINPEPRVMLFSRACQIDKIGLIDLALMYLVGRQMNCPVVRGSWVISLGFISAISNIYYTKRFNLSHHGHALKRRMETCGANPQSKFGPLRRAHKRMIQLAKHGEIPNSAFVKDLSLEFEL